MTARIIDGNALSARVRGEIADRATTLSAQGVQPCLAVILVGDNPASAVYVRNKVSGCEKAGIRSLRYDFPADVDAAEVMAKIAALNADPAVHGILVQMPLPRHIDPHKVIEAISTSKDVDGYSVLSAGELMAGLDGFRPCTPYGSMKLIESTGQSLKGKHAVVIGRSNTVMLGACADRLPFPAEVLRDAVLARFGTRKPQLVEANRGAFEAGRRAVGSEALAA